MYRTSTSFLIPREKGNKYITQNSTRRIEENTAAYLTVLFVNISYPFITRFPFPK